MRLVGLCEGVTHWLVCLLGRIFELVRLGVSQNPWRQKSDTLTLIYTQTIYLQPSPSQHATHLVTHSLLHTTLSLSHTICLHPADTPAAINRPPTAFNSSSSAIQVQIITAPALTLVLC